MSKIKPTFKFRLPIFDIGVKVYTGKVHKVSEQLKTGLEEPFAAFNCVLDNDICMGLPEPGEGFSECLPHECIHATWEIMELVGIPVNKDTEEVMAYINGYLNYYIAQNILE